MPKFSIIVPVYNTEEYINTCLDSIFNQTNQDFEIICINDGSTDNSLDVLNKYKNDIKIINQEHIGVSESRNKGINAATGKYIIFVDSDDYIDKELLQRIDSVTKNNPDLVRFGIKTINGDEVNEFPAPTFNNLNGNEAFKEIVKNPYVDSPCIYAYRKEFYKNNNFTFIPYVYPAYGLKLSTLVLILKLISYSTLVIGTLSIIALTFLAFSLIVASNTFLGLLMNLL